MLDDLNAYIDESYEPDGNFILGGYISSVSRWQNFTEEWSEMLPRFGIMKEGSSSYYFKHSAMSWLPERADRIRLFEAVAKRHTIASISCKINITDMRYARTRLVVPKTEIDFGPFLDPFKLAFRCLMDKFHSSRVILGDVIPQNAPVDFFFDEQISNSRIILKGWKDYLGSRDPNVVRLYGKPPTFLSDDNCMPLQAADMWAGIVRKCYSTGGPGSIAKEFSSSDGLKPWIHMEWNEDQLFEAFAAMTRSYTDLPIYDIRYGDAWDVLHQA